MLEEMKTYLNGIVDWLKRLFQIVYDFLGDIGVEV